MEALCGSLGVRRVYVLRLARIISAVVAEHVFPTGASGVEGTTTKPRFCFIRESGRHGAILGAILDAPVRALLIAGSRVLIPWVREGVRTASPSTVLIASEAIWLAWMSPAKGAAPQASSFAQRVCVSASLCEHATLCQSPSCCNTSFDFCFCCFGMCAWHRRRLRGASSAARLVVSLTS